MFNFNELPDVLKNLVVDYTEEYILLPWINVKNINWDMLSRNHNAIDFLEKNLDKIDWYGLSGNPSIFELNTKNIFVKI
jgi:hypothetical protein